MLETISPIPTFTSVTATGKDSFTLADEIKKYNTEELINFLRKEGDLKLDESDEKIIRKEKLTGRAFLKVTEEKLRSIGLGLGPASDLADFSMECKEKIFSVDKDKAATLVKEIVPTSHTTKMSYRDVLVKGKVEEEDDFKTKRYRNQAAVWEVCCRAIEAISLLPDDIVDDYNIDDIPDAPQEDLTEDEQDQLMWESFREEFKGSKAVELFELAIEMSKNSKYCY